jgi:hypothetical protein
LGSDEGLRQGVMPGRIIEPGIIESGIIESGMIESGRPVTVVALKVFSLPPASACGRGIIDRT